MKQKLLVGFFLIIETLATHAQYIKVIDMETTFPIENVRVSSINQKYVFHTNKEGLINIRNFRRKDTIIFSHPEYEIFKTTKREILKNGNVVELIKRYQKLDNVILSVSRTLTKKTNIAEQVKIIDKIEAVKIMPATGADLLELTGSLLVQKSQGGAGSPIIRGLEANRVLLVLDGIRLNNAISRTGHLHTAVTINPLILDRTEIIYGPSSIYGSDALGGVINFYTHTPVINKNKSVNSQIVGRYGSANNETTFHFNTEVSQKKWATFFAMTFSDYGDIRMGKKRWHGYDDWGLVPFYSENNDHYYTDTPTENKDLSLQPNTAYQQKDFFNKTVFNFGKKDHEFILETQYNYTGKVSRFDKLTQQKNGNLKFAEWYYGPAKRLLISPQFLFKFDKKWLKNARVILAYQDWEESRIKRKFNSTQRNYQIENVKVFSLNADFNTSFSSTNKLSYGAEAYYNIVNSIAYSKILLVNGNEITGLDKGPKIPTRYPDGGSDFLSMALYGNYRFKVSPKSFFNAGLRFTQTNMHVKWVDDTFIVLPYNDNTLANFALTGNLSYIFKPSKTWKMDILLSSGFRSPNIDDIGKIREKNGKVTVPNIYLKPEYAYNAEYGLVKYFNGQNFSISANVFYSMLMNYIARSKFEIQPGVDQILYEGDWAETYANVNSGKAEIYGGSLNIDGKVSRKLDLQGGIFYTKGRMIDAQRPLPSIPPVFGHFKLGYKFDRLETSLMYKFMLEKPLDEYDIIGGIDNIEQSPLDPDTGEYVGFPQWHTLSWYANYHWNKNFSINLGVENIFDVHYKEFASAISAPGRNFKFQILIKI